MTFESVMKSIKDDQARISLQEKVKRSIDIMGFTDFQKSKFYIENKNCVKFKKCVYNANRMIYKES